ncbi:MAG: TRAP transporter substrate-binding protein [Candidatus Limivicinus sp.]
MKVKKILALLLAAVMVMAVLTACGEEKAPVEEPAPAAEPAAEEKAPEEAPAEEEKEPELVLRYAENQPQDYPTTQAAYKFAELVNERTDGRIQIEVYYGGTLGDEKTVIEQLQFGGIDFTRVSISPLSEFDKDLNLLQMPYLYKDADQMWRVLDGEIGEEFLAGMEDSGMVGLTWFDSGSRNFYNSIKEISCVEDMKGMKIRVQESELMMNMVEALGAVPTPMSYGEVYSSLQTGVIDGAENNWPSYDTSSHYEVAKYFVLDGHTRVPEPMLISNKTLEKIEALDAGFPEILHECAREAAVLQRELWVEKEGVSEAKVREAGCVITELTPEEAAKFQDAMKPLYDKLSDEDKAMVERIKAA